MTSFYTERQRQELATLNLTIATAITRHLKKLPGFERMAEGNQLLALARDYFREQGEGADMLDRIHTFNVGAGDDPEESYEELPQQVERLAESLWDIVRNMDFLDSSEICQHIAEAFLTGLIAHIEDMLEYGNYTMAEELFRLLSRLVYRVNDEHRNVHWKRAIMGSIANIMNWNSDTVHNMTWVMNNLVYDHDGIEDYEQYIDQY